MARLGHPGAQGGSLHCDHADTRTPHPCTHQPKPPPGPRLRVALSEGHGRFQTCPPCPWWRPFPQHHGVTLSTSAGLRAGVYFASSGIFHRVSKRVPCGRRTCWQPRGRAPCQLPAALSDFASGGQAAGWMPGRRVDAPPGAASGGTAGHGGLKPVAQAIPTFLVLPSPWPPSSRGLNVAAAS